MSAIPPIRLLRLPTADTAGPDRCAVLSVEPSGAGMWMIRIARGKSFGSLMGGTAYGPIAEADLPDRIAAVLEQEVAQGYVQLAAAELISALESDMPAVRGRAAQRLGWRREKKAVAALLMAAERARGDICPILDALGRIGDPAAIDLCRAMAGKKNLSRRRSGFEALRNLGDTDGLATARQANHERLLPEIAKVLAVADETRVTKAAVAELEQAIAAEDPRRAGTIADALYERDTPLAKRVVRRMMTVEGIRGPHQWRYAKSILKRSMLRDDAPTFARLAYAIERASIGYTGATATLTSGLDGKKRPTLVFGKNTQGYVRRATWRYLRDLARYRPRQYVATAAQILCHYKSDDAGEAKGAFGAFADAFLLQRIVYGRSARLAVSWRTLRTRFRSAKAVEPSPGVREEAYPELWDRFPDAFLTIVADARLPIAQDFGLDGVLRHPAVLHTAPVAMILGLAAVDRADALALARAELARRFDADPEGWPLVAAVLERGIVGLRELSSTWLAASVQRWAVDPERLFVCLSARDPKVRSDAVAFAVPVVARAPEATRKLLADRLLAVLAHDEPTPGAHTPIVVLARDALVAELEPRFDLDGLLAAIRQGSTALKQVAGYLLGRRPGALSVLGIDGLVGLANNELIAVRAAGHAILRGGAAQLAADPSVLYALSESDWADTRELAFELLRALPLATLGVDGVIGLCDSTRTEVQAFGRGLVQQHFAELPGETVLFRLAEHPAQHMRQYALELVENHLRPGLVPLARIDPFVRATLFDLRPRRSLKLGLLAFLRTRGLMDAGQAEHVAALLQDVLRSHTIIDFQLVSQTIALVQVAFPDVQTDLRMEHTA